MMLRTMTGMAVVMALVATACGRDGDPAKLTPASKDGAAPAVASGAGTGAAAVVNLTPDQLFASGSPTFVLGTLGDDAADRAIATQVELARSGFPHATVVLDTSIDVAAGSSAWPPRPVLYGGAHVNAVIAALADQLPVQVDAERIVVGGERYTGVGDHVIAVVPAAATYPAFLLYAGTGTPGVVEINGQRHGGEPIVIGDGHGRLRDGTWALDAAGKVTATMGPRARRIAWRRVERSVAGVTIRVAFPAQLAAAEDEPAVVDAVVRGLTIAVGRLQISAPPPITVYVYPDRRSKQTLTGDAGDGHAMALASVLHVIGSDPVAGGGFEHLMTHEGTHAITGQLWAPAASALIGEGIAVWASGTYAGVALADWQRRLRDRPAAATLLPVNVFRSRPEAETYPLAGLLVTVAIEQVGLDAVRDHLFTATAATWADACKRAGTTAAALDAAVAALR